MQERTLGIVKPDAFAAGQAGKIVARYEQEGFKVIALKKFRLSRKQAEGFYAVHAARPFFKDLVEFMASGPCLVYVLEAENAIQKNRAVMGPTDPAKAVPGTLRKEFGKNIQNNAVHGSDAPETARQEIAFFFSGAELLEVS
jgi:nucleoside-diphosphate kinase